MTTDQTSPTPGTGPLRRARRGRAAVGLAMATASLALLTACSSGTDTSTTATETAASAAGAGQVGTTDTAFDQCLQQNGVTKPAGGPQGAAGGQGTPPGVDAETRREGTDGVSVGGRRPGLVARTARPSGRASGSRCP